MPAQVIRLRDAAVRLDARLPAWLAFRGTLPRRPFLLTLLPIFVISALIGSAPFPPVLTAILALPIAVVTSAVFVKRLRDAGYHPAFVLLGVVPLLGWIALSVLAAGVSTSQGPAPLSRKFALTGVASFLVLAVLGVAIMPASEPPPTPESSTTQVVEEPAETTDEERPDSRAPAPTGTSESEGNVTSEPPLEGEEDISVDSAPDEVEPEPEPEPEPAPEPEPEPAPPPASGLEALVVQLRVEAEYPSGYDRDLFRHWSDLDGNGCDTRRDVLIQEAQVPVSVGGGCTISGGQWYSAFDGVVTSDPSSFDIDHFVPLKEAWDSGAHAWDSGTRQRFANDMSYSGSLIAVSASSNRSKGARDPAEWLPPNAGYRCEYLRTWVQVKINWNLSADAGEVASIRSAGAGC